MANFIEAVRGGERVGNFLARQAESKQRLALGEQRLAANERNVGRQKVIDEQTAAAIEADEEQRAFDNKIKEQTAERLAATASINEEEAQAERQRRAAVNMVGQLQLMQKNGADPEEMAAIAGNAMVKFGSPTAFQDDVVKGILGENPREYLEGLKSYFKGDDPRRGSQAKVQQGVNEKGERVFFSVDDQGNPVELPGIAPPAKAPSAAAQGNVIKERKLVKDQIGEARKNLKGNLLASEAGKTVIRDAKRALTLAEKNPLFGAGPEGEALRKGLKDDNFFKSAGRFLASKTFAQDTREIQKLIDSIKANVGIDSLLKIKASGAGLGQVPQSQLEVLQSLLGNLDITRRPELLLGDLRQIMELYTKMNIELEKDSASQSARQEELLARRDQLEGRDRQSEDTVIEYVRDANGNLVRKQ